MKIHPQLSITDDTFLLKNIFILQFSKSNFLLKNRFYWINDIFMTFLDTLI